MKINRLDHLVLTVKNMNQTCDFYSRVLGMVAGIESFQKLLHSRFVFLKVARYISSGFS